MLAYRFDNKIFGVVEFKKLDVNNKTGSCNN
jgi:hypothetical protein